MKKFFIVIICLLFCLLCGCRNYEKIVPGAALAEEPEVLMSVPSSYVLFIRVIDDEYKTVCYLNTRGGVWCFKNP